jgi:hypothetical protein
MTFQTRYNPTVSFPVACSKVFKLSAATVSVPASYRVSYSVIGRNLGSTLPPEEAYYLYDNFGIPFEVFNVGSGTVDVYDQFNTGECPANGKTGIFVKSVWSGRAPMLSSVNLQLLHPTAIFNINRWNWDILWSNDPNTLRIPFENTNNPSITGYQDDQLDGVNFAEDYGENPKIELFTQDSEGVYWSRQEKPIFNFIDDKLDSIVFDLSDNFTGYLTISR